MQTELTGWRSKMLIAESEITVASVMALSADVTRLFTMAMPVNCVKMKASTSEVSALSFKSNNTVTTGAAPTQITQSLKQECLKKQCPGVKQDVSVFNFNFLPSKPNSDEMCALTCSS